MPHYALGTGRLSATAPPTPEPPTELTPEAHYALQPPSSLILPTSEAGWDAACGGDDIPVPTAIYPCTELTGSLLDHLHPGIVGRALAPAGSPLQGRRAVGLRATDRNGQVVVHPERGVECTADNHKFAATDTGFGNPGSNGFSLLVVCRVIRIPGSSDRAIVGKRESVGGGGNGYVLGVNDLGRFKFFVAENNSTYWQRTSGNMDDGAWHCCLVGVVPGVGGVWAHMYTDISSGGRWWWGRPPPFLDTTVPFRIGQGEQWDATRCQVGYLAYWEFPGDDLYYECLWDGSALIDFWTAFRPPPNEIDPPGDSLDVTHWSATGWPAGNDPFGQGNVVAKYGLGQFPYAVIGDADPDAGGYAPNESASNMLAHSEQFLSPWATTGDVTVDSNEVDAPDGLQGAARVTFVGDGTLSYSRTGTGDWLGAVWVKVESYDDSSAVLSLGGADFHPNGFKDFPVRDLQKGKWQRIVHTYPAYSGNTALTLRVDTEPSKSVVLHLWGAVLRYMLHPDPYVPTWETAGVSVPASVLEADWSSGPAPYPLEDSGRVKLKARFPYKEDEFEGTMLLLVHGAASGQDVDIQLKRDAYGGEHGRIILDIQKGGGTWAKAVSAQGTGLAEGQTADDAAEVLIEFGWSFTTPLVWLKVDETLGNVVTSPTGTFSGFDADGLCVGCNDSGHMQPDAPIYDVKMWNR